MGLSGRRVLVTGAGGFIGSHLVERLVSEGARVRAFLRYTSEPDLGQLRHADRNVQSEIEIFRGDLRDAETVRQAMEGREVVFHLGALISIPYSYVHPRETIETNVLATLNMLMAARDSSREIRFVHASSSEVYGTAQSVPMDESHPLQSQSPYAASKTAADKLVESFHHAYGLPATMVRPFNTYGPRQSGRAVIPAIVTQALRGNTVALGNSTPVRDLTYVEDTVDGFVRAAITEGAVGRVMNLGTSNACSIADLVATVGKLMGRTLQIVEDPKRVRPSTSEVERLISNNNLAKKLLGWAPMVSLESGLKKTIDWIEQHLESYRGDGAEV